MDPRGGPVDHKALAEGLLNDPYASNGSKLIAHALLHLADSINVQSIIMADVDEEDE